MIGVALINVVPIRYELYDSTVYPMVLGVTLTVEWPDELETSVARSFPRRSSYPQLDVTTCVTFMVK